MKKNENFLKNSPVMFVVVAVLILVLTVYSSVITVSYFNSNEKYLDIKKNSVSFKEYKRAQEEVDQLTKKLEESKQQIENFRSDSLSTLKKQAQFNNDLELLRKNWDECQGTKEELEKSVEEIKLELAKAEEKMKKTGVEGKELAKLKTVVDKLKKEKGSILQEKKQLQGTIKSLKEDYHDKKAMYYYNLGITNIKAKDYEQAVYALEKSLKLKEDIPEAYYNLGILYDDYLNDYPAALKMYQEYLYLKPDASEKRLISGWINQLEKKIGNTDKEFIFDKNNSFLDLDEIDLKGQRQKSKVRNSYSNYRSTPNHSSEGEGKVRRFPVDSNWEEEEQTFLDETNMSFQNTRGIEKRRFTNQEQKTRNEERISSDERPGWVIHLTTLEDYYEAYSFVGILQKKGYAAYLTNNSNRNKEYYEVKIGFFESKEKAELAAQVITSTVAEADHYKILLAKKENIRPKRR
ncbi:MAG: hypothetical protein V1872_05850 [bacterium]